MLEVLFNVASGSFVKEFLTMFEYDQYLNEFESIVGEPLITVDIINPFG